MFRHKPVGLPKNKATKPDFAPTDSLSSSGYFNRNVRCRADGTGSWIFDTPEYNSWHDGDLQNVLVIDGPSGTGKSVLAASIMDRLQKTEGDVPLLFFFCPRRVHAPQVKNSCRKSLSFTLVRHWLAQAFKLVPDLEDKVRDLVEKRQRLLPGEEWKWKHLNDVDLMQLWGLLIEAIEAIPKLYCVIDGIDAFQDSEDTEFLKELLSWKDLHSGNVKLLFTSNSVAPIENEIRLDMDNELVHQDVCAFLSNEVETLDVPDDTKSQIRDAFSGRSFLYTRLGLFVIQQDSDVMAISQFLDELPPTLYGLYDLILKRCSTGSYVPSEYRRTILSLTLYPARQLRRLEIFAALEVVYGSEAKDQNVIQSAFGPLLEIFGNGTMTILWESFISFIHDESRSSESLALIPVISSDDAHQELVAISMKVLMGKFHEDKKLEDINKFDKWSIANGSQPFLDYAASNWFLHTREIRIVTGDTRELLLRWFGERKECVHRWTEEMCAPNSEAFDSITPIHIAAWTGAVSMIELAVEAGCSYNDTMNDGTLPLSIATMYGHEDVVTHLLSRGADPNLIDRDGDNAIDVAVRRNHLKIVQILIQAGANVNMTEEEQKRTHQKRRDRSSGACDQSYPRRTSAFSKALGARNMEMIRYLIPLAKNPHDFASGMDTAATDGNIPMLKLLLTSPLANVNGKWSRDTPLFRAGLPHQYETMKFLLENGADPNIASRGLRSQGCVMVSWSPNDPDSIPLHAVAGFCVGGQRHWRRIDEERLENARKCCQLLLDAGSNVNAQGNRHQTPLHISVSRNLTTVTELLLQHGADPSITDERGNTVFDSLSGNDESLATIEILAKYGLKLDEPRGPKRVIPLFSMLLRKRGFCEELDPLKLAPFVNNWNVTDENGNNILNLMINSNFASEPKFISKLVQLGCDPRRKNKDGLEPLHRLCQYYSLNGADKADAVGQILIDAGGDIEAKDAKGCTPFHHLVQTLRNRSHEDQVLIPRFVRTFGVNVNAVDEDGNSALHMLFQGEPSEVVKDLVFNLGADGRATNQAGENLMHVLMRSSLAEKTAIPVEWVQGLAEYGISSTHQDQNGNTPLHVLCQTRLSPKAKGQPQETTWPSDEAVDLLISLDNGLSLEMENHQGLRPIHSAVANNKLLVAKLVSKGASTSTTIKTGQNILHIAASAREGDVVGFMLEHFCKNENIGLFLNQSDENGCTPLHAACKVGSHESVRLLVEAGAKLDSLDKAGRTPLDTCKELLDEVVKNSGESLDRGLSFHYYPYQDGEFGSESNPQTNDGGQMMEIIYFLGQAMGESPNLKGDYMPDTNAKVYARSCYTPAIRKGDYGVFQKCIEQGTTFTPTNNKGILDPLTIVVDGGYVFLFDLIAQSFPGNTSFVGTEVVAPYFMTTVARTQPNMPILRLLVEKFGADVNMRKSGSTTIWNGKHGACEYGALHIFARGYIWWHKEALKYLLAKGADPDLKDGRGRTPLQLTVKSAYHGAYMSKDIMRILLDNGANPNLTDEHGISPLDEKIKDPEVTELLVRYGGKPNRPDRSSTLCKAVTDRDLQGVRDILEWGQDPNVLPPEEPKKSDSSNQAGGSSKRRRVNLFGMGRIHQDRPQGYPLELAVTGIFDENRAREALPIVRLLLEHGADPFKQSKRNEQTTILHQLLQESESSEICEAVLDQAGLDLETRDSFGNTLFLAACKNYEERWRRLNDEPRIMRCVTLQRRGADIRATNDKGENALHVFASLPGKYKDEEERKSAMSALICRCPELVHQRNKDGFTAFQTTWKSNALDWTWQILLDGGADFMAPDPDGNTVLHATLKLSQNRKKWFKHFLDSGMDLNSQNKEGETSLFAWARHPQSLVEDTDQLELTGQEEAKGPFPRTIYFLKQAGFDFHVVNVHRQNLLHVIAQAAVPKGRYRETALGARLIYFKEFVEYGLDPLAQDKKGWSALVG
ncbi:Ankyrin repeat-containing protein [Penicillium cataractarum]|uniref:Ankyrin repeat-containing protein n=1 Tax=Penicillium cataractarum TaxID=2100454 RepID=A0A9W9RZ40_9EURO|nr:Ankyrin repeat-containing protein [Penicillium cataractarum]KAJ5369033.1 Ankyrin repeat-containing protein [Penicillium cataractarum]